MVWDWVFDDEGNGAFNELKPEFKALADRYQALAVAHAKAVRDSSLDTFELTKSLRDDVMERLMPSAPVLTFFTDILRDSAMQHFVPKSPHFIPSPLSKPLEPVRGLLPLPLPALLSAQAEQEKTQQNIEQNLIYAIQQLLAAEIMRAGEETEGGVYFKGPPQSIGYRVLKHYVDELRKIVPKSRAEAEEREKRIAQCLYPLAAFYMKSKATVEGGENSEEAIWASKQAEIIFRGIDFFPGGAEKTTSVRLQEVHEKSKTSYPLPVKQTDAVSERMKHFLTETLPTKMKELQSTIDLRFTMESRLCEICGVPPKLGVDECIRIVLQQGARGQQLVSFALHEYRTYKEEEHKRGLEEVLFSALQRKTEQEQILVIQAIFGQEIATAKKEAAPAILAGGGRGTMMIIDAYKDVIIPENSLAYHLMRRRAALYGENDNTAFLEECLKPLHEMLPEDKYQGLRTHWDMIFLKPERAESPILEEDDTPDIRYTIATQKFLQSVEREKKIQGTIVILQEKAKQALAGFNKKDFQSRASGGVSDEQLLEAQQEMVAVNGALREAQLLAVDAAAKTTLAKQHMNEARIALERAQAEIEAETAALEASKTAASRVVGNVQQGLAQAGRGIQDGFTGVGRGIQKGMEGAGQEMRQGMMRMWQQVAKGGGGGGAGSADTAASRTIVPPTAASPTAASAPITPPPLPTQPPAHLGTDVSARAAETQETQQPHRELGSWQDVSAVSSSEEAGGSGVHGTWQQVSVSAGAGTEEEGREARQRTRLDKTKALFHLGDEERAAIADSAREEAEEAERVAAAAQEVQRIRQKNRREAILPPAVLKAAARGVVAETEFRAAEEGREARERSALGAADQNVLKIPPKLPPKKKK